MYENMATFLPDHDAGDGFSRTLRPAKKDLQTSPPFQGVLNQIGRDGNFYIGCSICSIIGNTGQATIWIRSILAFVPVSSIARVVDRYHDIIFLIAARRLCGVTIGGGKGIWEINLPSALNLRKAPCSLYAGNSSLFSATTASRQFCA